MASGPSIVVEFLAKTSGLTTEVDKAAGTAGNKMAEFGKKAALAVGGAFAINAVVDFGKAAVEAAAADEEAQRKLATTLKNVTGATDDQVSAMEDYIDNASKSFAITDDELRPAMDRLVRGFGNTEDAQAAMNVAMDVAAGTGKDLSTVTDAMAKAADGQTGALKRLGVETENADGSAKSLDQIMKDMSETFAGQAAGAADSTAGKMQKAQIAMAEMQETIGALLIPVLGTMATILTETVLPAIEAVFGWIVDNKELVIIAIAGIAAGIAGVALAAIPAGVSVVGMFIAWAAGAASAALATALAAAPFVLIGAAVAALVILIVKNWDTIKEATEKVWNAVKDAVEKAFNWVKDNWPLLLTIITGPIGAAVWLIKAHWEKIQAAAKAVWDWLNTTWDMVTGFITAPVSAAIAAVETAWAAIKTAAKAVWDWLNTTWDQVTGFITAPVEGALDAVETVWTGIKSAAKAVWDWLKNTWKDVTGFITAPIEAVVGIIDGVIGGIRTAISNVVSAIKGPINAVIKAWNGLEFRIPSISIPEVKIPGIGSIGGGSIGGQTIGFPNLPLLAGGGVLTDPTLFIGGEAGTEIVAPESMLRQIVAEESGGHYTLNIYTRTADIADVAYGFRRLELMAGVR